MFQPSRDSTQLRSRPPTVPVENPRCTKDWTFFMSGPPPAVALCRGNLSRKHLAEVHDNRRLSCRLCREALTKALQVVYNPGTRWSSRHAVHGSLDGQRAIPTGRDERQRGWLRYVATYGYAQRVVSTPEPRLQNMPDVPQQTRKHRQRPFFGHHPPFDRTRLVSFHMDVHSDINISQPQPDAKVLLGDAVISHS